jgi:hypothetical protein
VSANYRTEAGQDGVRPSVDARTLWAGGLASAAVAALGYAVGVVIVRGVFDVPILAPRSDGALGDASTWQFSAAAFVAALLATALMHVLLVATPRPFSFFGWIVGLVTVLLVVLPFAQDASLSAKIATAVINLVVGIIIGTLVAGVGRRSLRRPPAAPPRTPYR